MTTEHELKHDILIMLEGLDETELCVIKSYVKLVKDYGVKEDDDE